MVVVGGVFGVAHAPLARALALTLTPTVEQRGIDKPSQPQRGHDVTSRQDPAPAPDPHLRDRDAQTPIAHHVGGGRQATGGHLQGRVLPMPMPVPVPTLAVALVPETCEVVAVTVDRPLQTWIQTRG